MSEPGLSLPSRRSSQNLCGGAGSPRHRPDVSATRTLAVSKNDIEAKDPHSSMNWNILLVILSLENLPETKTALVAKTLISLALSNMFLSTFSIAPSARAFSSIISFSFNAIMLPR